jgi:hypothetical protein
MGIALSGADDRQRESVLALFHIDNGDDDGSDDDDHRGNHGHGDDGAERHHR